MSDAELINSIRDMQAAAPTIGISSIPFRILETEVQKLINRAGHYQALYESMCAQYGAEVELPPLEE